MRREFIPTVLGVPCEQSPDHSLEIQVAGGASGPCPMDFPSPQDRDPQTSRNHKEWAQRDIWGKWHRDGINNLVRLPRNGECRAEMGRRGKLG